MPKHTQKRQTTLGFAPYAGPARPKGFTPVLRTNGSLAQHPTFCDNEELYKALAQLLPDPEHPERKYVSMPPERRLMGKRVPRKELLVHSKGSCTYKFGGKRHASVPLSELPPAVRGYLRAMFQRAAELLGHRVDVVLINFYKDGNDSVSDHSDNDDTMDPDSKVLSVSVGATRDFKIKTQKVPAGKKQRQSFKIPLVGGSALIMFPRFQTEFLHGIPKITNRVVGSRFNLTFRKLVNV